MSDEDKSSKTEEPTPKKLNEAWEKGQFPKAPEVPVAFVLIAAFIILAFFGPGRASTIANLARNTFTHLADIDLTQTTAVFWIRKFVQMGFAFLFPMMGAVLIAAIIGNGLQTGFRLSLKAMEPKYDRLNPVQGFQNLFSMRKMFQFLVDLLKFSVVGVIIYTIVKRIIKDPIFYDIVAPDHVLGFMYELIMIMLINLIVSISAIAAVHFLYQHKKTMDDLKMTKQEVRDEMKNSEGDPHVKRARRELAMRLSQKQMLQDVAMADVVVTNPTHFAVALKYERGVDKAPVILAKGEQRFAKRIKEIARQNEVPMVENKPVARMLFRFGKVGEPIPSQLYQVIAEILSYVYRTHKYYFYQLRLRRQHNQVKA